MAGLWSDALIEGLAWQGLQSTKDPQAPTSQTYIAPSWSWVSYDGITTTGKGKNWREITEVLDYHLELKTRYPYGELKDGWIRIKAPVAPVSLSDEPEDEEGRVLHKGHMRLKMAGGDPFGGYASFHNITTDDDAARVLVKSLDLFALVLGRHDPEEEAHEKEEEEGQQKGKDKEAENKDRSDNYGSKSV